MLIWLLFWLAFPGSSSKLSCHNMTSSLSKMMSSSSNMTQLQILEFMPTSNSRRPWDSSERVKGQVLCKGSQVCEMGLCSRWLPTYFLIYPLSITATQQGNKMFSTPQLFYRIPIHLYCQDTCLEMAETMTRGAKKPLPNSLKPGLVQTWLEKNFLSNLLLCFGPTSRTP